MATNYNPIPPRAWSRVEHRCTYDTPDTGTETGETLVFVPLTGQTIPAVQAKYEDANQYKGNILQYKANSSRLSKNQVYSKMASGTWSGRRKVWATQSLTYTNPNTSSLARVGTTTWPSNNTIVGAPNNVAGPFVVNVPNPFGCPSLAVEDGGVILCNTYVRPCPPHEVVARTRTISCTPSTAADVPGQPVALCWNSRAQTFFPRGSGPRDNNSGNKWPTNYKGFVGACHSATTA